MIDEVENFCRLTYYNMQARIVFKNRMSEENVAIKNAWEKNGNIFMDLYFYRAKKGKMIDGALIHDLLDLNTEKYYHSAKEFYKDFIKNREKVEAQAEKKAEAESRLETIVIDIKQLEDIRDDLIILIFMAKCNSNFTDIKTKSIRDYITCVKPQSKTLSEQYISNYLKSLNPDEEDFYQALENLKNKTPEEASALAADVVKVSASDGAILYNERIYLAELLQALREHGLEPDVGF